MSNKSNAYGRAYEYAWMKMLNERLSVIRPTIVAESSSLYANKSAWNSMNDDVKKSFSASAQSALDTLLELEPMMRDGGDVLKLSTQLDRAGQNGDVRDIILSRESTGWEIGLSIKHNHDAVKHSRLSRNLDFGKKWYGIPCSKNYFSNITPIFDELVLYKKNKLKWADINDKDDSVYLPILQAFIDEINRAYKTDAGLAQRITEYLVGIYDFYKIVSKDHERVTLVYSYNLHGNLNRSSSSYVSAITVPLVDLPTRIVSIEFKPNSKTTVELYLDNGWQFSFRLHSASTYVESSLKFDVQLVGSPQSIMHLECKWKRF